jgi:Protein of unknown function DUF262
MIGYGMPTHQVNLDSLILRQPFESVAADSVLGKDPLFKLEELHRSKMYFGLLRKPDFQRETANWNPAMILDFVSTFLDGGLIPSIIIWHSKDTNNVFIIDGAHRVSALMAWVNDDYGDGEISRKAWGYSVPQAQVKLHNKTKELIDRELGSYAQLFDFGLNPENTNDPIKRRRGKAIATMQLDIQKVEGNAAVAEDSFYKINSNSVAIDDIELDIIRGRKKPNAIATRALVSAGKGYKYWKGFPNSKDIEDSAAEGYNLLMGELLEIGTLSPDLPRAGQPYSSEGFRMVLDIVNIFNSVTPAMWTHKQAKGKGTVQKLPDDEDGSATIAFLERVIDVARLVAGPPECNGSLGLEQAVYAYGSTGNFHPGAYVASLRFFKELREQNKLIAFTVVRGAFEEFIVRHKAFINALGHTKGSRTRPVEAILQMYKTVFAYMQSNESDSAIVQKLENDPILRKAVLSVSVGVDDENNLGPISKKFSKTVVKAKVVQDVLATRGRCPVCTARLPPSYRSKDHAQKGEHDGMGNLENLHFTHPYCNHSRDAIEAAQKKPTKESVVE